MELKGNLFLIFEICGIERLSILLFRICENRTGILSLCL